MAENLQNIILGIELPPPEGNWERIVQRLDAEFDQSEMRVSERFNNLSLTPPSSAWENIASAIETTPVRRIESAKEPDTKVVPLFKRKWMSAAVTTGLVLLAALFYLLKQNNPLETAPGKQTEKIAEAAPKVNESIAADAIGPLAGLIPKIVSTDDEDQGQKQEIVTLDTVISNETTYAQLNPEPEIQAISSSNIQPVKAVHEAKVSAPAIRDKEGNIILNLDLLTSTSSNYISVTAPNGEQTRVSSKFAQYLAFMNEDSAEEDDYIDFLFKQSGLWRQRFSTWRSKLAQESAFAPSSAFFFDILELKELIKD